MKLLSIKQITVLQKEHDIFRTQELINSGEIWKFEGSAGRHAMSCLESGECFLPTEVTYDYYGNRLPSRNNLKNGTKGTLGNSQRYWSQF